METTRMEIYRYKDIARGWGHFSDPMPTEEDILNTVMKFSNVKRAKIYRHLITKEWVENKKYGFNNQGTPKGDEVWYLTIYYQ